MNDEHLIAVHRNNGVLVLVGTPRNNVMAKTSTASMTDHRETREPRTSSTVSTRPMWGLTVSLAMTRSSVISHPAATQRAARVTLGASASTDLPASLCGRPCEEPAVEHQGLGVVRSTNLLQPIRHLLSERVNRLSQPRMLSMFGGLNGYGA
jgi:hypothetical protein